MKTFRLSIGITFILLAATFAFAQTDKPQSVSANKIAVIDPKVVEDEKTGVKDFIEIYKKLEEEFKPQLEELKIMYKNILKLQKEFEELNRRCNESVHCSEKNAEDVLNKLEEHKISSGKFKNRQEEVKSLFDKRKAELSAEVNKKIAAALNQFAKEKGYALILDSRMNNLLIDSNETFIDITSEFIKYYDESFDKIKLQ